MKFIHDNSVETNLAPGIDSAVASDATSADSVPKVIMTQNRDVEMRNKTKLAKYAPRSKYVRCFKCPARIQQVQIHVYQNIHDCQPSLSKMVECRAGIDLKLLSDKFGMQDPCRVSDQLGTLHNL